MPVRLRGRATTARPILRIDAEAIRVREAQRKLRSGWAELLRRYEWDHWATLTPRFAECSARALEAEFVKLERRLAFCAMHRILWIYMMERSPGGVLHIHVLLYGTASLTPEEIRRQWKLRATHAEVFVPERGGAQYLAKDLHLDNDVWDTFRCSTRLPAERMTTHGARSPSLSNP